MDEQLLIDDVGATIIGQDNVLVRDRASTSQKNSEAPHGSSLVAMEGDEWIPEENAICRICFSKLAEENTVKSECRCTIVLVHEECANNWSSSIGNTKCDLCEGEVNNTPVTLLRGFKSAQKTDSQDSIESGWGFLGLELDMEGSSRQPSLLRGRAYIERIKLPDGATSTGQDIVIVRDRASASVKNSKVAMEGDEWIEDEEAICRICFSKLGEENTVESKCGCTVVLAHEECTNNWSSSIGNTECDLCRRRVNNTPVTLLRGFKFAQNIDPRESTKLISLLRCTRFERYNEGSSRQPSLFRGRAYIERIKLPDGATSTGQDIVIVRDKASASEKNSKVPHSSTLVAMEGDEWIEDEKAICRICFSKLGEENTVKSKCGCKIVLEHEECATNKSSAIGYNKCHVCKEEANNTPVTLLRGFKFAQNIDPQETTKVILLPPSFARPKELVASFSWGGMPPPSFARGIEQIKLPAGDTITSGIVIVRDRDSASRADRTVVMKGDKEIAEEEAICRICFSKLEDAALKSNCECGELLTHEKCVTNWSTTNGNNKCNYCEQEANNIPVTLLRRLESTQPTNEHESTKRQRWWRLRS